jgi:hypothetical protein
MKKYLISLTLICVIISSVFFSTYLSAGQIKYGDTNRDGSVNSSDLAYLEKYIQGDLKLSNSQQKYADLNADKKIDSYDISLLEKILKGLAKNQPSSTAKNPSNTSTPSDSSSSKSSANIGTEPTSYLNLDTMQSQMTSFASKCPDFIKTESYGTAGNTKNMYMRVSKAVSGGSSLPKLLITGATHGDEWISAAIVYNFAFRYINGYNKDTKITQLINSRDVYFVPVVNPRGYSAKSRYEEGKDPNRSYPFNNNGASPTTSISNIMKLFQNVGFNATIDYHASGRMVLTPWAYTNNKFNEGTVTTKVNSIASQMASTSGYKWGQVPSMVGYTADGSSLDWYYFEGKKRGLSTVSMGVEAGTTKIPAASQIKTETDLNYKGLLTFIESSPLNSYGDSSITPPKYNDISEYFVPGLE